MKRQIEGEILRRFAPQNDTYQNQRDRLLEIKGILIAFTLAGDTIRPGIG